MNNKILTTSVLIAGLIVTMSNEQASANVTVNNNSTSTVTAEIMAIHWNSKDPKCNHLNSDPYHSPKVTIESTKSSAIDTSAIPHTSQKEGCTFYPIFVNVSLGTPVNSNAGSCHVSCDEDASACTQFLTSGKVTITNNGDHHLTCETHS